MLLKTQWRREGEASKEQSMAPPPLTAELPSNWQDTSSAVVFMLQMAPPLASARLFSKRQSCNHSLAQLMYRAPPYCPYPSGSLAQPLAKVRLRTWESRSM